MKRISLTLTYLWCIHMKTAVLTLQSPSILFSRIWEGLNQHEDKLYVLEQLHYLDTLIYFMYILLWVSLSNFPALTKFVLEMSDLVISRPNVQKVISNPIELIQVILIIGQTERLRVHKWARLFKIIFNIQHMFFVRS